MPEKTTASKVADFARRVLHVQNLEKDLPPEHVQAIKESMGRGLTQANEAGDADRYEQGFPPPPALPAAPEPANPNRRMADHYAPGGWHNAPSPAEPVTLNDQADKAIRVAKAPRPSGRVSMRNDVTAAEFGPAEESEKPKWWDIQGRTEDWVRTDHPNWVAKDDEAFSKKLGQVRQEANEKIRPISRWERRYIPGMEYAGRIVYPDRERDDPTAEDLQNKELANIQLQRSALETVKEQGEIRGLRERLAAAGIGPEVAPVSERAASFTRDNVPRGMKGSKQ